MLPLNDHPRLLVQQVHELAEFIGFESRNKYQILAGDQQPLAFAAEQSSGLLGTLARQALGHWRRFDLIFFDGQRQPFMRAHHPFRWLLQRLEISDHQGAPLGAIQQRFSLLHKEFDLLDVQGQVVLRVASPLWKLWTFPFVDEQQRQQALVAKRWSGAFSELMTDRDNFLVEFEAGLNPALRHLVLAAAVFIDLQYFEAKASG
ncbi:Scramblase [Ferrimonas sediminum]|uniref:Scramblase n=2 Tax=Ferrimonas sediminum TaxID=718193 RepID=A0A1G8Q8V1_9GAMM|nr:Scramblase [Ferrimonas sediminum]